MKIEKTAKVILISGSGKGKSYIRELLEKNYKEKSIRCSSHFCHREQDILKTIEKAKKKQSEGFIIVEFITDCIHPEEISPWQHIELSCLTHSMMIPFIRDYN